MDTQDTRTHFDLVVIGGGPGGYGAALYATSAGLDVAIVEMNIMGGTCLNRGCIPAKAFLETAAVQRHVAHAAEFGIESSAPTVNFATAQARKQKVVDGIVKSLVGFMKSKKITILDGTGSLGPGGPIMTSDEVLMLDRVPERMIVVGGGAIGCEFASTFADVGSKVTILEGLPKILPGLDNDVANVVVRSFKKKQIDIRTSVSVKGHTPNDSGGTTVHFEPVGGGPAESLDVDVVLVSIGRRPYADQLGLAGTGVVVDGRGFVQVDELCRTGEEGVYAIGDLIATPQLAHVGYAEAIMVTKDILGEGPVPVAYDRVPWAIYCDPEVAFVGPSEEAAKEAGLDVVVAKHQFRANSRAQILGTLDGLVKVIAKKGPDGKAGQILGVHMVGPWVTEQLSGGYLRSEEHTSELQSQSN